MIYLITKIHALGTNFTFKENSYGSLLKEFAKKVLIIQTPLYLLI